MKKALLIFTCFLILSLSGCDNGSSTGEEQIFPPSNITARVTTEGIIVNWSDVAYATSFDVFYGIEPFYQLEYSKSLTRPVNGGVLEILFDNLTLGKTYKFAVKAKSATEETDFVETAPIKFE